jgi:butyrate kinase
MRGSQSKEREITATCVRPESVLICGDCTLAGCFFPLASLSCDMPPHILVINPGSTSTKLALFEGQILRSALTVRYESAELDSFAGIWKQFDFRMEGIRRWIRSEVHAPLSAVVAMGGLLRPVQGGTYRVNDRMLADARANLQGEHASNLGCAMADALAREHGCQAYVGDPVSVDEIEPLARYSGHPLIQRSSLSHALNIHAAARRAATELGRPLGEIRLVVAHLGGGISVAPVLGGKIIDVNDANSDGPFSPERTGGLPLQQFIALCYSGTYSEAEIRSLVRGRGGLTAYLGTPQATEVERRIADGDALAREVFEAMAYQISKEIGAMATVLKGALDAVVLTGGLAGSAMLTGWIQERVQYLGQLLIYPGEDEMRALAEGALRVLQGAETAAEY